MRTELLRFAAAHLSPYRVRGDELIPDLCPFCQGGEHGDRYTFALNLTDGVYVCKRGQCGARGRFEELAAHFGERSEILRPAARAKKQYVLPDVEILPRTEAFDAYFGKRKIGQETLDAFHVGSDRQGNIVFPFYRDNVLEYVKFRAPRKPLPGEKKEWQASSTRPILFGMDLCSFAQP